jgi:hypothetical protein
VTTTPGGDAAASTPGRGHLRASDADREQVIDVLKSAFVQGRLAKGEFDVRVGQAFASRTHADLAAVTADLPTWLLGARPPQKPALAKAEPSRSTDISPAVAAVIAGMTVLTAGLWATVLAGHTFDNDGAKGLLLFLVILTFTNVGALTLTAVAIRESRHRKRSDRQVPPSAPRAGGQVAQRRVSGASAEHLPQVDPAQPRIAEAQWTCSPGRDHRARGRWCVQMVGSA